MNPESEIPAVVTGAGGMAALGYWWLRTILSEKKDLISKLEESDLRERELTAKVIEALLLNTTFLENHQGDLAGLGSVIKKEVEKLSCSLKDLSDELLKRQKFANDVDSKKPYSGD